MLSTGTADLRAVERLARKLYDANDPGDIPWARRGWDVRKGWLNQARQKLEGVGASFDGLYIWHKIKSLFRF